MKNDHPGKPGGIPFHLAVEKREYLTLICKNARVFMYF